MKKILEKSGNFVRGKKWEPCVSSALFLWDATWIEWIYLLCIEEEGMMPGINCM